MNSIPVSSKKVQEGIPSNLCEFPIAEGTTPPGATGDQVSAQDERPNKYKYPEFEGLAGERYLLSIAEQIAPLALWRTWYAAVSFQAPGQACYVGVGRIVERVGPKERKIYLDLAAMEARGWLNQERAWMSFTREDGSIVHHAVTIKDFSGFYDCAHDYHLWIHSPEYIAPERENAPLILSNVELTKRLIRFECYRRILLCAKPGRKPREAPQDFYTSQIERLEQIRTGVQNMNLYFNAPANTCAAYRVIELTSSHGGDSSSSSTSERSAAASPTTIRNRQAEQITEQHQEQGSPHQVYSKPKPNPHPMPDRHSAAATKGVGNELGYTEEELKHDPKKRGAAAAGIPAEQYAKLNGGLDHADEMAAEVGKERPAREIPTRVETEITTYAGLYDDAHLIASDVTRCKKIYATAEQALAHFNENLFWAFYDEARSAAAKYAHKRRNSRGRVNRIPYMFTCLENAFNFSLEELVYLRTEDPLYTDYSLWDVIDHLRKTHQQQYYSRETALDYRDWLQAILDQLERGAEPKQRINPTRREY
jgi:hypothetical protein